MVEVVRVLFALWEPVGADGIGGRGRYRDPCYGVKVRELGRADRHSEKVIGDLCEGG